MFSFHRWIYAFAALYGCWESFFTGCRAGLPAGFVSIGVFARTGSVDCRNFCVSRNAWRRRKTKQPAVCRKRPPRNNIAQSAIEVCALEPRLKA